MSLAVARIALATLAILVSSAAFLWFESEPIAFWTFPLLAALSPVLLLSRRSGAHIAARAIWVSTFLLGLLAATAGDGVEATTGVVISGGALLAIAAAGGLGLRARRGATFTPLAFRRTMILSLVMVGIAAQWLGIIAGASLSGHISGQDMWTAGFGLGGLAMLSAGFYGVLRLKLWGFALMGTACAGLVASTALGAYASTHNDSLALWALAAAFTVPVLVVGRVLWACRHGMRRA
jgi:hypothetical protein